VTIHLRVAAARETLVRAGIAREEAELDARLLAEFVLGWTTERYFVDANLSPPADFEAHFDSLIARRASREPFAYIVGCQEFWGLRFHVTPSVLIPRPETELIVEAAVELIGSGSAARIADIGTGSGCVAIAIARERPAATIVATDSSDEALAIALQNAVEHDVASRITFIRADLLDALTNYRPHPQPASAVELFDLIVSNPPYVPEAERAGIQPEVRYEPPGALFAGTDGLDVIRRLMPPAAARLKASGALVFEFGFGQATAVEGLISASAGVTMVELRRDLQGIPRIAIARRRT